MIIQGLIFDGKSREISTFKDLLFWNDEIECIKQFYSIIESKILIRKYNSQYNNVRFINNNSFHDRFIIIDRKEIYTIGSSIKDMGKKITSINKINDEKELNKILEQITNI